MEQLQSIMIEEHTWMAQNVSVPNPNVVELRRIRAERAALGERLLELTGTEVPTSLLTELGFPTSQMTGNSTDHQVQQPDGSEPDGSDHDGSDHDGGNPIMLVVHEDGNHDVIGLHDPSIVPGNPIRVLIVLRADGAHVFLPGGPENYEDDNLMAAMVFEQATPLLPQDGSLIGMDIYPRFIRNHTDPPVSFENLHLVEPTVQDRRQ
jgi:hypothetical protein